jgi:hypothetical protein
MNENISAISWANTAPILRDYDGLSTIRDGSSLVDCPDPAIG